MQNESKIAAYIGFAIKSKQAVFGADSIEVYRKKIHLIVISDDLTVKSKENIENIANKRNLEILQLDFSLQDITKRKNCKVLAITNFELAKAIKNNA